MVHGFKDLSPWLTNSIPLGQGKTTSWQKGVAEKSCSVYGNQETEPTKEPEIKYKPPKHAANDLTSSIHDSHHPIKPFELLIHQMV